MKKIPAALDIVAKTRKYSSLIAPAFRSRAKKSKTAKSKLNTVRIMRLNYLLSLPTTRELTTAEVRKHGAELGERLLNDLPAVVVDEAVYKYFQSFKGGYTAFLPSRMRVLMKELLKEMSVE